ISCTSMAYLPKSAASRLVQVRALQGNFPYYGTLETEPPPAAVTFRTGLQAIVDDGLLLQFDAQVGDTIDIIRFKCCPRSAVNRKLAVGDDKKRGDCASRTQSPSRDPRCLLW